MVDVFISYPRRERERAEPIREKLQALGLDVFFDIEGIDTGSEFPDVIDAALKASKAVLACWSPLYFTRKWCLIECRFAATAEPSILVPVATERVARNDMKADFLTTDYRDLTRWRGEDDHEEWNRTLQSLGRLVGRELAPPLKRGLFGGVRVGDAPEAPAPVQQRAEVVEDLRRTWETIVDGADRAAVLDFRAHVDAHAPGTGLAFEVKRHLDALDQEAERQRQFAARAQPGSVWRDSVDGLAPDAPPEMVTLPPGRFLMGAAKGEEGASDDEYPQHEVTIAHTLAMGRYAVTFAEWDAARAAGARLENLKDKGWGRHRRPVINVSWEDAVAYLDWLNTALGLAGRADAYRLPSEAEWEYACRGVTDANAPYQRWSFGDDERQLGKYAWFAGNSGRKTHPVGEKRANAFGLHDMHGNVWEWCADPWHDDYKGAPTDGSVWTKGGNTSLRVRRGGSCSTSARNLRSASRGRLHPTDCHYSVGFRLARTISP